jgi:hypothetical protein
MNVSRLSIVAFLLTCAASFSAFAQIQIGSAGYFQDFDDIAMGLPESWSLHTGASTESLGTSGATFSSSTQSWGNTAGGFKNFASSTGLVSTATATAQENSLDRALGVRQGGSLGNSDPGAAFVFNFSSLGATLGTIELDLLMLGVQTRSTTWTIDYGIGAAPTSFTMLDTWMDPGAFGSQRITISEDLAELSNQPEVWLRIVALDGSTGTGNRDSIAIDNFAITAIPEPSTYVALCGATALLFAFVRRIGRRGTADGSLTV